MQVYCTYHVVNSFDTSWMHYSKLVGQRGLDPVFLKMQTDQINYCYYNLFMVQLLYCILYLYCLFLHTSEFECSSVKLKCSEKKVEIRSKIIVNYLPITSFILG